MSLEPCTLSRRREQPRRRSLYMLLPLPATDLPRSCRQLKVLRSRRNTHTLPVNSVRIFNAYGTRSRTTGAYGAVFGVFLAQKLAGKPLTVVGNGTQKRDFLYVTDVVSAFYAAARTHHSGRIYNLGAG